MTSDLTYAVIGAGPSGLAAARNLQRRGIPWAGYELGDDVGGLWNIDGPRSTVYESAHLISSKRTTEFSEFPMGDEVADYPSHRELLAYFRDFADDVRPARRVRVRHRGGAGGAQRRRLGGDRAVRRGGADGPARGRDRRERDAQRAVRADLRRVASTARCCTPARYKSASVFAGQAGAGHRRRQLRLRHRRRRRPPRRLGRHLSVRRGYYFVPKYLFGKPADTLNQGRPLPPRIKQAVDSRVLQGVHRRPDPLRLPGAGLQDLRVAPDREHAGAAPPRARRHPGPARRRAARRRRRACSWTASAASTT